jgi:hypothetical protein
MIMRLPSFDPREAFSKRGENKITTIGKVGVVGFLPALTVGIVTTAFPQSTETKTMNQALSSNADRSQGIQTLGFQGTDFR